MGSPSVERAIQILDFLTTHPGRGFTLSELSRRLSISKATARGVLAALTDRALLLRDPSTNDYQLGPALVPMGSVAERTLPALSYARVEVEQLAEEFDCECVIIASVGDEILVVGRAGLPGPQSITSHDGQRHPLAPPLGSSVIAWADDQAIEAWLGQLGPESEARRARYGAAIESIRRQGYAVGIRTQLLETLSQRYAEADMHSPEGRREFSRALAATADAGDYLRASDDISPDAELSSVAAPIFGPDGSLLFAIALMPTGRLARELPVLSRAVVRAKGRVMAAIEGREPLPRRSRL